MAASGVVCRQPYCPANNHTPAIAGRAFTADGKMARGKLQRGTTAGEILYLCRTLTGPGLTIAAAQTGKVYLVGAGPGDPGLLTLRAVECLQVADVVIYDQLVSERLLDWAPQAEKHCVREWGETHEQRAPRVSVMLVDYARRGKTVVRLKGGDPLIFGRGGEEFLALAEAGIPFEIVPGISAAQGAAAYMGVPLTHRSLSSAVAFITGHQAEDSTELDWASLARFPGTLAIYMGFERLGYIAEQLIRHGLPADTPAITVQWATTGKQRSAKAPLGQLAEAVRQAGLAAPAITLIGSVVGLRKTLSWWEQRPLLGRRILLIRPRAQAQTLARQLELLGAVVDVCPLLEIGPPPQPDKVRQALTQLGQGAFHWVVFTSRNGVQSTMHALWEMGADLRIFGRVRLAAIGPGTAQALAEFHLRADVVPEEYRSENLAESLLPLVHGCRVLLLRADRGRDVLPQQLSSSAEVEQVAVYSQRDITELPPIIADRLRRGEYDFIPLTSSNLARALARLLDAPMRAHLGTKTQLVALSPVTGATLRELGLPVHAEASEYTMPGLVQTLLRLAQSRSGSSQLPPR